jgi:hypothetical protein
MYKPPLSGRFADRIRRFLTDELSLVLLVVGIAGFFLAPRIIDEYARRQATTWNATHYSTAADLSPIALRNSSGTTIGWLRIKYLRSMRENEDAPLDVEYLADRAAWSADPSLPIALKLAVSVRASHLSILPQPNEYAFDIQRVMRAGGDNHIWTVSPEKEGDYTLVVRLDVAPSSFRAIPEEVNGSVLANEAGEIPLPVTVYTEYLVPQAAINLCKAAGAILSFLLTLPMSKIILDRYLAKRSRKRGQKSRRPKG